MNTDQNLSMRHQETPKRGKPSDDEYSPNSLQQQKVQKKMDINPEVLNEILTGIRKINSIESNLANVMQQMDRNAKSEELEPLRRDIADIKNSQEIFRQKIESIEKRVSDLENDFDGLKNGDVDGMIEEVDQIRACTQQLSQNHLNNYLIIRHFPLEIKNDRKELFAAVNKIFTILQFDICENDYDATAMKVHNKDLAFIQLKFSSQLLKGKVLSRFRQMKKLKENEPQFVVEKITGVPADHSLNGTTISMHNRLTRNNIELLQAARTHVPKFFDFVFDDAEGRILAKCENSFKTVCSHHDIEQLITKIDQTRRPPQQARQQATANTGPPRRGRSGNTQSSASNRGRIKSQAS